LVLAAEELFRNKGAEFSGDGDSIEERAVRALMEDGVPGLDHLVPGEELQDRVTWVPRGYVGLMHACMPHGGMGVPAMNPFQANFGFHLYVMRQNVDKGVNGTHSCPPGVQSFLANVVL
jgi:hypothetical protein